MRNDAPAPPPDEPMPEPPPEEPVDAPAPSDAAPMEPEPAAAPAPAPAAGGISLQRLQDGWNEMLDGQSTKARARFLAGEVQAVDGDVITFVLPIEAQLKRCEPFVGEIEAAIQSHFGQPATLRLATGPSLADGGGAPSGAGAAPAASNLPADDEVDIHDLTDADVGNSSVVDRITDVFPGAEVMAPPEN